MNNPGISYTPNTGYTSRRAHPIHTKERIHSHARRHDLRYEHPCTFHENFEQPQTQNPVSTALKPKSPFTSKQHSLKRPDGTREQRTGKMSLLPPPQAASRSTSMYIEELDPNGYPPDARQSRVVSQPAALLDQCR